MAIEIEEGVVEVTAEVNRSSLAKAAKAAGEEAGEVLAKETLKTSSRVYLRDAKGRFVSAGKKTGEDLGDGIGDGVQSRKKRFSGILKGLFTPDPGIFQTLRAPFEKALSTPVGLVALALGASFALMFAGAAITAVAGLGLGAVLLGVGALALLGGKVDRDKAMADLDKAEKRVKDAEFAARKGSAASVRNLAEARKQLAEAQKVVNEGKAFVALDNALNNVVDTLKSVGREAAMPLLKPFTSALNQISGIIKGLGPDFKAIFTSLAPVVPMLTTAFGGFASEVVSGLKDSMPGIVAAFEGFARVLPTVGRWLGDFFRTIFANSDVIDNTTASVTKFIFGPLKLLGPVISGLNVAFGFFNNMLTLNGQTIDIIKESLIEFLDGGTGAIGRIKEAWGPLGDAIQNVWDKVKAFAGEDDLDLLETRFEDVVLAIKDAWGPLEDFLTTIWNETWVIIQNIWDTKVVPWWNNTASPWLKTQISAAFETAFELAKQKATQKAQELITGVLTWIVTLPVRIASILITLPAVVLSAFGAAVIAAVNGAKQVVEGAYNQLKQLPSKAASAASGVRGAITSKFSGAGSWLYNAGRTIIQGLVSGIGSAIGSAAAAAARAAAATEAAARSQLGSRSPSKVFEAIGKDTIAGLANGLGFTDTLDRAVRGVVDRMTQNVSGGSIASVTPSSQTSGSRGGSGITISVGGIQITVTGGNEDDGRRAGQMAADVLLERLGQAALVR